MKTIIMAVSLLLISTVGLCHYINPMCLSNGRFKFQASSMPVGKTCTIKIVSPGASWDTSFIVKATSFTFTIPMPNSTQNKTIKVSTSDGFVVVASTTFAKCDVLPLKLVSFKMETLNDYEALATAVVEDVTGVSHINIRIGVTPTEFKVAATVKPDNMNFQKTYTAIIPIKNYQ